DDATDARVGFDWFRSARGPGSVAGRRWLCLSKFEHAPGAKILQFGREPIDRVAAPVQAQGFFFVGELLGVAPGLDGRQRWRLDGARCLRAAKPAKELRLPFVSIPLG